MYIAGKRPPRACLAFRKLWSLVLTGLTTLQRWPVLPGIIYSIHPIVQEFSWFHSFFSFFAVLAVSGTRTSCFHVQPRRFNLCYGERYCGNLVALLPSPLIQSCLGISGQDLPWPALLVCMLLRYIYTVYYHSDILDTTSSIYFNVLDLPLHFYLSSTKQPTIFQT